ncbi:hypothetical protein PL321_11350 [Caloramator sp. mosi_1]|uniref:hypothetical protein n=1 Tax=Caloramator sp. mosi_1 TaxID=3023090 RepID=UPI002362311D|nr:hypothetical protein [Caloramator sp. mosi_1]WDC83354.1 hypothetical protein PL321_11350 [Caloramator sp. mosi_1]
MSDNITMNINIIGEATEDLVIEITMFRDGIELPLKPKQKVGKGENVLSIPYVLTQVKEGVHNLSFKVKTSLGEFRVNKGQFVLILQGKSLEGGIVAEPPYPQKVETIVSNILFVLQNKNTIEDKIDSVVISNTTKIQNNETINLVQSNLQTKIIESYFVNFKIAKTYIELLNVDYIIDTTIYNLENKENILITQKNHNLLKKN